MTSPLIDALAKPAPIQSIRVLSSKPRGTCRRTRQACRSSAERWKPDRARLDRRRASVPRRRTPTAGCGLPWKTALQTSFRSNGSPNFQPAMTGVAEPFFCAASQSGHQKVWILQNTSSVIILQLLSMNRSLAAPHKIAFYQETRAGRGLAVPGTMHASKRCPDLRRANRCKPSRRDRAKSANRAPFR